MCAQTEVCTMQPKGGVVAASETGVEGVGVVEVRFVEVGRYVPEDHLVALHELLTAEFGVVDDGAAKVHRRGRPAKHFVHERLHLSLVQGGRSEEHTSE